MADFFLSDLLANSPLDHHGRAIADILHKCISLKVPSFAKYLDSRLLSTRQLEKLKKVKKHSIKAPLNDEQNSFVTVCETWPSDGKIKTRVFEKSDSETACTIKYFDIPYLHDPNREEADAFATALADS